MAEKRKKRKKETPKPINPEANENFVIVDSSYLVFYRFYATILWYKRANKDVDVCLLKSKNLDLPHISMSTKRPEYGEKVYNIASPMGISDGNMVPLFTGHFLVVRLLTNT